MCGRSSELLYIAFSGTDGMMWDTELNALVLVWKERKTFHRYPLALVCHVSDYSVCPWHAFAYYGLLGGFEHAPDENARASNSLFKTIHASKSVTATVSAMMVGKYGSSTSKAARQAGITVMEHHPGTCHSDTAARSGHTPKIRRPRTCSTSPSTRSRARRR